jgi:hypothetical protein
MQLKFIETINIEVIQKLFKETFGEPMFLRVVPNTQWVVFSLKDGYPLDQRQQTWLADRYEPNKLLSESHEN